MSIRYVTYLLFAVVAGFVVLVSQAFDATAAGWLTFGAGAMFALVAPSMTTRRGLVHRAICAGISTLGILIVIETLLASGGVMTALSLAGGLAVLALSLAGLTLQEISTERVVHSLEIAPKQSDVNRPIAA
jgi:hypothetical protein